MFERYTEKARRVIFFARYEASQYGSPYIETEHLLLGLLREDQRFAHWTPIVRPEIESGMEVRERISTSVEVPLSPECKRILGFAAEEAARLGHRRIETVHLLLGILREEKCVAALILTKHGATLNSLREKFASEIPPDAGSKAPPGEALPKPHGSSQLRFGTAVDRFLEAWAARDAKKLASFFARHGQFWDIRGELWLGPAQVEKGLAAHFASSEPPGLVPDIKDVKFVTGEVSVATLVWEPQAEAKKSNQGALRMVLVLYDAHPGWLIVSAHLALLQPGRSKATRKPV